MSWPLTFDGRAVGSGQVRLTHGRCPKHTPGAFLVEKVYRSSTAASLARLGFTMSPVPIPIHSGPVHDQVS